MANVEWYPVTNRMPAGQLITTMIDAQSMGFHFKLENGVLYHTDYEIEQDFETVNIPILIPKRG